MLTLYMSCKGTFLFKAAKTPHATPGHVITLKDIMLLTNFRNAPLFITSAPPQLNLLNRTSSMEPPEPPLTTPLLSVKETAVRNIYETFTYFLRILSR